jgi:hypothetical protein
MKKPSLQGEFAASRWWERLVRLTNWVRRRPISRRGVPPLTNFWASGAPVELPHNEAQDTL